MKKNVMMRVASIMLVLVLLTSSVISGTFAKYVTSGSASDSARVAKFGVVVTGTSEIFSDSYLDEAATYTENEELATITVQADTQDTNVVAPGTKGELVNFVITGQPEVDVEVTYAATVDVAGWNIGGAVYYCPLYVTVEETVIYGMNYTNEADFEDAIEDAIVAYKKTYHTNTDLSTKNAADELNVSWEWKFEGTDGKQTDAYDTKLGDQAVTSAATIAIEITCTVTQVD